MSEIKVLIVDDSVLARRMISTALEDEPDINVVGTAVNGANAITKLDRLDPDIVIMDLEMPEMDGIEALKAIKKSRPDIAVLMFSSLVDQVSDKMVQALEFGAEDYIAKPSGVQDVEEARFLIRASLVPKIIAICQSSVHKQRRAEANSTGKDGAVQSGKSDINGSKSTAVNGSDWPVVEKKKTIAAAPFPPSPPAKQREALLPVSLPKPGPARSVRKPGRTPVKIIAIGVSTGGPNALAKLMPSIPVDIPVPIVIVQHMPASFTKTLARRLDASANLPVSEGREGVILEPGKVWIAPGGYHMVVEGTPYEAQLKLNTDPPEQGCRPAVDVLFRSVAKVYKEHTLALILTGMGKDGLEGSQEIVDAGGSLFAQDEATSVVWGMPGAVTKAGLPEKVIPLERIGYELMLRIEMSLVN